MGKGWQWRAGLYKRKIPKGWFALTPIASQEDTLVAPNVLSKLVSPVWTRLRETCTSLAYSSYTNVL